MQIILMLQTEERMTQDNIFKRINLQVHQHSYFGMVSLLFGFIGTAIGTLMLVSLAGPTSWSYVLLSALPGAIMNAVFGVFPILGPVIGIFGLFLDQKKVFSILGLLLIVAFFVLSHIFATETLP